MTTSSKAPKALLEPARVRRTVRDLLRVPAGELTLDEGAGLLAGDVVMHLDGFTMRGMARWRDFVGYLSERRAARGLALRCETIDLEDDVATWRGAWVLDSRTWPVVARFRVRGDRVVELWSRRANYTAPFGERFTTWWGFAGFLVRVTWWRLIKRRANR